MLEIIKGKDEWEFIKLTNDNLNESMIYLALNPSYIKLWINFSNCSEVIDKLLSHPNLPDLKAIHFETSSKQIIQFQNISHLESLSFGYENSEFDFSQLIGLKSISGVWSKKWKGLDKCCNLTIFSTSKFKEEISLIPNLSKLETIVLIQPIIKNISGISAAKSLKVLELLLARQLSDISTLSSLVTLKTLVIDGCKKIISFREIESLKNLEKLLLVNCGFIESISFLKQLKKIEFLSLYGTKIMDNNLGYCLDIPSLKRFGSDDTKTYIPRRDEINKTLSLRE